LRKQPLEEKSGCSRKTIVKEAKKVNSKEEE
jgi:hypothetical protein